MKEVLFWGATGQARVLSEALSGTDCRLVAIVDNRDVISPLEGVPVLMGESGLDDWLELRGGARGLFAAVAVGGPHGRDRIELMDLLQARGLKPLTIIHRAAFVALNAHVEGGCQIMAQAAVCANVRLGRGVIVNTAASVDHDCVISNGVHIAPGVRLAGEVIIGEHAFIGVGALVLPRINIGKDAIVGAGAVVIRDVLPGTTVIGNPARRYQANK